MRGLPPLRPRARAAFTLSRTRWRMTLRSISANAAWICRKARPAGVVVHGRVEGAETDAALVEFVDEGDELAGAAPEPVEVEDDEDIAAAQVVEAGGEARAIGRGAGGVILEHRASIPRSLPCISTRPRRPERAYMDILKNIT